MNPAIPNFYDAQNARLLAGFAAAAYDPGRATLRGAVTNQGSTESHPTVIDDAATDTRVVISSLPTQNSSLPTDVVVAFRGTRSLRNFVTDVCARRVALRTDRPGRAEVHEGFQRALDSVFGALCSAVEQLADSPGFPRIWITGHSLGAALAMLCAWRISNFKSEISHALAGVYTFGEPRVGNAAFRDYYDCRLKPKTFRVVDGEDFITRIPWLLGAYRHCGTEVFYSAAGTERRPYQIDPPWWVKGVSDVFGTWREYHDEHRLALLADHHVSRYVGMLSAPNPNLNLNPNPVLSFEEK